MLCRLCWMRTLCSERTAEHGTNMLERCSLKHAGQHNCLLMYCHGCGLSCSAYLAHTHSFDKKLRMVLGRQVRVRGSRCRLQHHNLIEADPAVLELQAYTEHEFCSGDHLTSAGSKLAYCRLKVMIGSGLGLLFNCCCAALRVCWSC